MFKTRLDQTLLSRRSIKRFCVLIARDKARFNEEPLCRDTDQFQCHLVLQWDLTDVGHFQFYASLCVKIATQLCCLSARIIIITEYDKLGSVSAFSIFLTTLETSIKISHNNEAVASSFHWFFFLRYN